MREIVLDTETTGFEPSEGDRIVEIGAVELINHMPTGNNYHVYINPERTMPESAFKVHGLSDKFLRDKPVFAAIADDFLSFIGDSKLVIHNASFDMKFINAELSWIKKTPLPMQQAIDTLDMARKKFPGSPASLDALCRRFNIDNSARTLHGALLDSEILAEVYLELIGGRQPDLVLEVGQTNISNTAIVDGGPEKAQNARAAPLPSRLSAQEAAAHSKFIEGLGENALWKKFGL